MRYIIDIDLLDAEGFDEVVEIIKCYGEPLEDMEISQNIEQET